MQSTSQNDFAAIWKQVASSNHQCLSCLQLQRSADTKMNGMASTSRSPMAASVERLCSLVSLARPHPIILLHHFDSQSMLLFVSTGTARDGCEPMSPGSAASRQQQCGQRSGQGIRSAILSPGEQRSITNLAVGTFPGTYEPLTVCAQAIQMVLLGRSSIADQIFRLLGCTFRLSDALLSFKAHTGTAEAPSLAQSCACILSPALPGRLVLRFTVARTA